LCNCNLFNHIKVKVVAMLTISKKVFTVPATSALVECLLSETGKILNPLHYGGLAETVTAMVLLIAYLIIIDY